MGGGGGFVSAITDPISDVLGTSGGDGGLLGAVEDVGGFIGDAGEIIDNAVIQPVIDDPVNTAIKLGAYYVGGPLGSAAASAGISAAQGNDIEDIARDAAVSYVAGQVGGEVGGAVAGETGSQLAGNLAQGGTSGATSAVLSGRDPVTGFLSGVTNAGITQGVNTAVDYGAGLFTPSTAPTNVVASNTSGTTSDVGVDPTYQAWLNAINSGNVVPNRPLTQAELQAAGITTGNTGMGENLFNYDVESQLGGFYGGREPTIAEIANVYPSFEVGGKSYELVVPNQGDVESQLGGFYGGGSAPTATIIPGELGDIIQDAQGNIVLSSGADIQAAQSLGFDTKTLTDYAKQFGTQALRALLGTRGGSAGGAGAGAGGTGTQGGLLGAGANYLLSDVARRAIQSASQQSAQQQLEATRRAEAAASFKPVGVTTAFGQSQFQFDPVTGQLTSAGYTATPQVAAQRERLFTLGAEALPTTADTAALQQQYLEQQRGLLAPSREQQLAQLRNRQFQRGTGGLATGGTVAGYAPGAAGLMQTNPEMAAYYNALAREDATLAANAPTYAQNLLNQRIATGTNLFTQAGGLETMAQQPLTLGAGLGTQASTAGARAGLYGLTGAQGAAQTQLYGNVAGASGQLGQTQGLLTGVSPYLQQAGNYVLNNWLA